ncbi:MAG: electron transport complex subunit RsxB [Gammaproteobacteria bacterium]|nr:electron transport complex subunit RsxB [Gammaproteobacteria bacterium]
MTAAIAVLGGIALVLAIILSVVARRLDRDTKFTVVEQINALLPQTQCGQCNYPGCRPYAEALAAGEADINQCPPGGTTTIVQLAQLLGRHSKPLNPDNGSIAEPQVAFIHEAICIGCKKCILACPVDAIVGAPKKMHTVIASECTGCALCVEPCPVDCIDMLDLQPSIARYRRARPEVIAHD